MAKFGRFILDFIFIGFCTAGIIYGALYFVRDWSFLDLVFNRNAALANGPLIVSIVLMALASLTAVSSLLSIIFFFRKKHWGWTVGNALATFIVIGLTIYIALVYYNVVLPYGLSGNNAAKLQQVKRLVLTKLDGVKSVAFKSLA